MSLSGALDNANSAESRRRVDITGRLEGYCVAGTPRPLAAKDRTSALSTDSIGVRTTVSRRQPLPLPAGAQRRRIAWPYATAVVGYHAAALLACLPWFFSWTGVVLAFVGLYVFGTLGINIGYHRLLAHRGFSSPRWVERLLAILGVCCMQESPVVWVALHRQQFLDLVRYLIEIRDGGTAIPYDEEDPYVRTEYEDTLRKQGATSRMEQSLYERNQC
jgi:hypothetical protein